MRNPKKVIFLFSLLVHVLFWVSLGTGMINPLFNDSSHRIGKGGDFFQFYQAGADVVSGCSIYRTENKKLVIPYGALYKYPPLLGCTVGVISQTVSPWSAYRIWLVIIGCAFVVMLFLLKKIVFACDFLPILSFSLVSTPYYLDLYHGQTNTVMAMLISMIMYGFLKKKNLLTMIPLAVSMNIKLMTVFLIPIYLSEKKWKNLSIALVVSIGLFLPYFLFFKNDLAFFLKYVFGGAVDYFYQAGNFGVYPLLKDIISIFTYDKNIVLYTHISWIVGVMAVSIVVHIYSKKRDPVDMILLWLTTFFLVFKFVWEHHFVMLIPVLAVEYSRNNKKSVGFLWLLFAVPTAFYFFDINLGSGYTEVQPYWSDSISLFYHCSKILPVFVLYTLIILRLFDRKVSFFKTLIGYFLLVVFFLAICILKPVSARDYHVMARQALRVGKKTVAKKCFEKSIQTNPRYADVYVDYIRFLYKIGDIKKARAMAQRAGTVSDNKIFK